MCLCVCVRVAGGVVCGYVRFCVFYMCCAHACFYVCLYVLVCACVCVRAAQQYVDYKNSFCNLV